MMRFWICTMLVVLGFGASAQEGLLTLNKTWIDYSFSGCDNKVSLSPIKWTVGSDTVIEGKNCKVMHSVNTVDGLEDIGPVMLEQDGAVSYRTWSYDRETGKMSEIFKPLMNFNVKVGDRLPSYDSEENIVYEDEFVVKEVTTESVEGIDRKVIRLSWRGYMPEVVRM